eukprot:SAG11_NODE_2429_length_3371_cov_5.133863_4_plen_97_part_00
MKRAQFRAHLVRRAAQGGDRVRELQRAARAEKRADRQVLLLHQVLAHEGGAIAARADEKHAQRQVAPGTQRRRARAREGQRRRARPIAQPAAPALG